MGKVRYVLRDGKTMKIVRSFYVVSGVAHCDLMAFSDRGESCMWLAFVWSDGEPGIAGWARVKIFLSRVVRFVLQIFVVRFGRPFVCLCDKVGGCDERGARSCRL